MRENITMNVILILFAVLLRLYKKRVITKRIIWVHPPRELSLRTTKSFRTPENVARPCVFTGRQDVCHGLGGIEGKNGIIIGAA